MSSRSEETGNAPTEAWVKLDFKVRCRTYAYEHMAPFNWISVSQFSRTT